MAVRKGHAKWEGKLQEGNGVVSTQTKSLDSKPYSFSSRFEEGKGTNPEELIAAAHAGCFSMALSAELGKAGYNPTSVTTEDRVHLEKKDGGFTITTIDIITEAVVPDIDEDTFLEIANGAKANCPVSRALTGVTFTMEATLNS